MERQREEQRYTPIEEEEERQEDDWRKGLVLGGVDSGGGVRGGVGDWNRGAGDGGDGGGGGGGARGGVGDGGGRTEGWEVQVVGLGTESVLMEGLVVEVVVSQGCTSTC